MLSNPPMTKPQNASKAAVAAPAPAPVITVPSKPVLFYVLEDWLAALGTFAISLGVFLYYMCPSVTLQDSGELVTGAYRFGVPHPSGYPLWALLGWIWRHFVQIGDPAAQITSFSACTGAAVVALMTILTKRATLVLLNAVPWRTPLEPLAARILSLCAGLCAGLMFAFNRGVWLWSCVPEMRILSVFMYMLTAFLCFKWMMQPERRGLLLTAVFIFGLGIANHQTTTVMLLPMMVGALIVGFQVKAATSRERLVSLWAFWEMLTAFLICLAVSYLLNAWLAYTPPQPKPMQPPESVTGWDCIGAFFLQRVKVAILFGPSLPVLPLLLVDLACIVVMLIWGRQQDWLRRRWVLITAALFMLGIAFYLYMPIAASTNPPMNWGFTATREGFLHHITRGQYQKLDIASPLSWNFVLQNYRFITSLGGQFTYVLAPLGLLSAALFWFWPRLSASGRIVLVFLWTAFISTSLGLIFIINPGLDEQTWGIAIKFFAPAHGFFAALIALALALMLAWLWTQNVPQRMVWVGLGCVVMLVAWTWPLRINWESCEQRNHDFGYQFGFRMFHPGGGYPDMEQDAVLYGGTDPGRFVPTYMIFCESFANQRYVSTNMTEKALVEKCRTFDRRDVYIITQNALADGTYMNYIRDHYDFTRPNPDKPATIAKFTWWQQAIMRFAWKRMGRDITYPKEPIHIPSPPEANDAFRQFVEDVQLGRIQAGADVRVENGRVSVEGVQGVMAINGILAKWIFEKNKDKHAFYVEESYVIPWMYPYLRPAGVIMKIEKEQLPPPQQDQKLWEQIITKDFAYWDQLLGEFIKRPEFKRDSDAKKAFSKLRCAIAGVYEYRGIVNAAEAAYSQAIAICPESPEASFRLSNLYMRMNQAAKAVETLSKLAERDPFNKQVREALEQFRAIQNAMTPAQPPPFPIIQPK